MIMIMIMIAMNNQRKGVSFFKGVDLHTRTSLSESLNFKEFYVALNFLL